MKRGFLFLFVALLFAPGAAAAQDASVQDDLRFVEALRKQGKSDLALEYLQRLAKNPSPELQKALPLELARTRLDAAGEEPDSGKRLQLYTAARDEFQKWLQANAADPRANEVKLDIARVAVLQGRTQLSQALMNADFDSEMVPEALKARAMLEDAGAQVQQAAKDLDAQIAKAGDPMKKTLENARMQAELDIGLNLFDQGQTYPAHAEKLDMRKARNDKIQQAQKVFQKLASRDDQNPVCWAAKAWDGRCSAELDEAKAARERFNTILEADPRVAAEAQRLARYFRLLVIDEAVGHGEGQKGEDRDYIKDRAADWVRDYPGYLKTPEGYGIRFLLASDYAALAAADKDNFKKAQELAEARKLLRQVEASENDFTDRARQLKIQIIATQQGGFKEPVERLKTFDDCYVRAQYELNQMAEEEKKAKPDEAEAKRKAHQAVITAALERGLKLAGEQKTHSPEDVLEMGNAKAMLAYQYLNAKKYREAIAVAEPFAQSDPRSATAAVAASYALQCYAEMVGAGEAAGQTDDEMKALRGNLLKFAAFMEKAWPKEAAGDLARYQLALVYINDRDPDRRDENVQKAIEALGRVTPSYSRYTVAQYQLAQFCFQAEKDRVKPLPGDGDDGYRKRALAALRGAPPPPPGADPTTNKVYFLAKIRLAQEDFTLKNFDEMQQLSQSLLPMLGGLALDADPATNDKLHTDFAESIKGFRLYALWAKADAEAKAADKADAKDKPPHYAKIAELLDPVVKEVADNQHPELKNNLALARGILDNDLRAAIQLNKLDQAQAALNAYKQMASGNAADAGAAEVLKELVIFIPPQLDELKRKNDPAALEAAKKKFGEILADTLKPLPSDKLTPKLKYFTARIYSSLDKHKEAAELLEKMPGPSAGAPPDTDLYESVQVMLAHERRLDGDVKAARDVMDAIMGTKENPGWGRKKIDALIENVELLGAEGDNKQAAEVANALVQKLLPRIDADNKIKDLYLQCYYLVVENVYRQAVKIKDRAPDKYPEGVKTAATLAVDLARKQLGFVNDATRGRFHDLMDAEPDLKDAFLDGYLTAVETRAKEKALSDAADLLLELGRMWPDDGGDKAKARVDALLGGNADLKAIYDMRKGSAPAP